MCEQLPWICVHCSEGITNDIVQLYGVNAIPTYFIVARGSELLARDTQIDNLEHTIETELGKSFTTK